MMRHHQHTSWHVNICPDHVHPVSQYMRLSQYTIFQLPNKSRTFCRSKHRAESTHYSPFILRYHVLSAGENTRRQDEHNILHLSDETTYCLREKIRWDIMSTPFCIHLTRSRTIWANRQEALSVYHSAFIRCDFWIPPIGKDMRRRDEHTFMYLCNKKTYNL